MKPTSYRSLIMSSRWDGQFNRQAGELANRLEPILADKYLSKRDRTSRGDTIHLRLVSQLPYILCALDGQLEGKTVLDLGCGTNMNLGQMLRVDGYFFQPWLCRALQELGAHPIGIDLRGLDREEFEHYHLDLTQESLDNLADNSVDCANACALFDSPTLTFFQKIPGGVLERTLDPQLGRVVKPNGLFLSQT